MDESPTEVWKGVDLDSELIQRSNESSRRKKIQLRKLLATSVEARMRVPPNTAVLRPTTQGEISRVRRVSEQEAPETRLPQSRVSRAPRLHCAGLRSPAKRKK